MRTDFTAITEAIDKLITTISEKSTELIDTANEQRIEYLLLRQKMADTANDLEEFGMILDDAGKEIFAAGDMCSDIAEKIHVALADANEMPTCRYEDFVAICDNCGNEIYVDSDYEVDDNGQTLCAKCAALVKEKADAKYAALVKEEADEDGEQLTIDIAATAESTEKPENVG